MARFLLVIKHGCRIGVLAERSVLLLSVLVSRSAFCLAIKTVWHGTTATPIFCAKLLREKSNTVQHGLEDDYSRHIWLATFDMGSNLEMVLLGEKSALQVVSSGDTAFILPATVCTVGYRFSRSRAVSRNKRTTHKLFNWSFPISWDICALQFVICSIPGVSGVSMRSSHTNTLNCLIIKRFLIKCFPSKNQGDVSLIWNWQEEAGVKEISSPSRSSNI